MSGERPDPKTEAMDALESRLAAMAASEFPPTPDLASGVRDRIAREAARRSRWPELDGTIRLRRLFRPTPAGPRLRVSATLALFALLVLAGVTVAGTFGIGPLRFLFVEALPSVPPTLATAPSDPAGAELRLGRAVTQAEAEAALGRPLARPDPSMTREPDAIWLDRRPVAPSVALVWRSDETLPALEPGGGTGLLLTQVRGTVTPALGKKLIDSSTTVERTSVGGGEAYWVHGDRHVLLYTDASGAIVEEGIRLVGDVLIWQDEGTLYRLESNLGLDATRAIAESVR